MEHLPTRRKAIETSILFGAIPCLIGVGIGQYLRLTGTVWLSNAGAFWPSVCLGISIAVLVSLVIGSSQDRTARVCGWAMLAWTWLYVPLWFTAREIEQSSAVVTRDGRVFGAAEWARNPRDKVWLLTRRADDRIIRKVAGTITVHAADVKYRYSEPYISRQVDAEDLSTAVTSAVTTALAEEAVKPRSWRIALFHKSEVHERWLAKHCRAIAPSEAECPLKLSVTPRPEATVPGAVWSKVYTGQEAVAERHLPTLVQLLTQDDSQDVERDRIFALFMDLTDSPEMLSTVARKSATLSATQFDELIKRMLASPGCGDEALSVLSRVNRLTEEHRRELRAKVLREASLSLIATSAFALRLSDAEVARIASRVRTPELTPEVAVVVLERFGERLPLEAQQEAIASIVGANASYALAALRHVNFSGHWRQALLRKVVSDATLEDLEAARLSREALEDLLTPAEMRSLVAVVIKRGEGSAKWLSFAVRALPLRAMAPLERKSVLNGLLFENTKSAFEYASEHRHYLEPEDVNEITTDYTRTITPDFCLHLSHRNKNRKTNYFSEAQLQIFRDCAQSK